MTGICVLILATLMAVEAGAMVESNAEATVSVARSREGAEAESIDSKELMSWREERDRDREISDTM